MKKYRAIIAFNASMDLPIRADSPEEAERKVIAEIYDEDALIDSHRNDIFIWAPNIYEIVEEE